MAYGYLNWDGDKVYPACPVCFRTTISCWTDPNMNGGRPYTCYEEDGGCGNIFAGADLLLLPQIHYYSREEISLRMRQGTMSELAEMLQMRNE